MSNKKIALLLMLVLALGCIGGGGGGGIAFSQEGLRILSFDPDMAEIASGKSAGLRLQVQNTGESQATDVKAEFYRVSGFTEADGSAVAVRDIGALDKPAPATGLPGETAEEYWTLRAPPIFGRNERVEKELGISVGYTYQSTATAEVPILTEASYLKHEQTNDMPKSSLLSSKAPVKAEFIAPERAFDEPFPLKLRLSKAAGGYVESEACAGNETTGVVDEVKIEYSPAELNADEAGCADFQIGKSGDEQTGVLTAACVQLWKDGKRDLACDFVPVMGERGEIYPTLTATATYRHHTEASTRLTIRGEKETG